jgi:hypothetical protein
MNQFTAQDYRDVYSLLIGIRTFKQSAPPDGRVPYFVHNISDEWIDKLIKKMSDRMDEFDATTNGPRMKFSV